MECTAYDPATDEMVALKADRETVTLLFDRIAILVDREEKWANTNIYKPEISKDDVERPRGTIVAVGPGKVLDNGQRRPMSVQPGDRVIFQKYSSQPIEVEGQKLLVVEEHQVITVLNR